MHLILLDKKLTVFQGMKATYHLKATCHLTQLEKKKKKKKKKKEQKQKNNPSFFNN